MKGYESYANGEALELAEWAVECNNRVKASKIKQIADKMEDKYRENSPEFKRMKAENRRPGGVHHCLFTPLFNPRPDDLTTAKE